MNTKKIPLFIMLLAGAVACIVTYINHYNLHDTLVVLIVVLMVFLILGLIVKKILLSFDIAKEESVADEGEVVEKAAEGEEVPLEGEAVEGAEPSINDDNQDEDI